MKEADRKKLVESLEKIEQFSKYDSDGKELLFSIFKKGMPHYVIAQDVPELGWREGDVIDLSLEKMGLTEERHSELIHRLTDGAGVSLKKNNEWFRLLGRHDLVVFKVTEEKAKKHPQFPDNWEEFVEIVKKQKGE